MVADCTAQHTRIVPVAVAVESRSGQRGAISKRVLASDGQAQRSVGNNSSVDDRPPLPAQRVCTWANRSRAFSGERSKRADGGSGSEGGGCAVF